MKTLMVRILTAVGVVALCVSSAAAQEPLTEAKRADILQLMQMTGSGQLGLQFGDAMVTAFTENMKKVRPDIPPRMIEIVRDEVSKLLQQQIGVLIEQVVPIYHQQFTHEEIKGLLQFYGTPVGRKVIQAMPTILQQSMAAGQAWGRSLAPTIEARLRTRFAEEGLK